MKNVFLLLATGVIFTACNNSADSTDNKKDSLDSVANLQKKMVDSTTKEGKTELDSAGKATKQVIDSTTEMKKKALDSRDSARRADSIKRHK
jgi:hypothetical protein